MMQYYGTRIEHKNNTENDTILFELWYTDEDGQHTGFDLPKGTVIVGITDQTISDKVWGEKRKLLLYELIQDAHMGFGFVREITNPETMFVWEKSQESYEYFMKLDDSIRKLNHWAHGPSANKYDPLYVQSCWEQSDRLLRQFFFNED